jgi:hypothetical protein
VVPPKLNSENSRRSDSLEQVPSQLINFTVPGNSASVRKRLFWIFALSSCVYFVQGIEGLPAQGLFYYMKEALHFSPEKIMVLNSIIIAAWVIKPVIGFLIDNFLRKSTWIFIALGLDIGLVFFLGFWSLPMSV